MTEPVLNPPAIHGEAVAGAQAHRAQAVRKALHVLSEDIRACTFDMAVLLHESKGYVLGWGFESLYDYGAKELGLKRRKIEYLVRIVEVCNAVGVKRADYEPVGVSKLREITSLKPEVSYYNADTKQNEPMTDHIVRLLAEAQDMSADKVDEEVRRLKGEVGEDRKVWLNYPVTQSVLENVIKPAQELVRQRLGSAKRNDEGQAVEYSDSVAEEMIHAEFLADPTNYEAETDESKEQVNVELDEREA